MIDVDFWKLILATTTANFLTVWFLFSVYRLTKAEARGQEGRAVWYAGAIMPGLFIAGSFYLIV